MSKDKIEVNMNVHDIPIVIEELEKAEKEIKQLQQENQQLKENYDRIYNENCKLREEHNITDISLLDENQQLKKQKDDAIKYIKSKKAIINTDYIRIFDLFEIDEQGYTEELLRMLGEIDE